mgnify:CR=1 FL=1
MIPNIGGCVNRWAKPLRAGVNGMVSEIGARADGFFAGIADLIAVECAGKQNSLQCELIARDSTVVR